MSWRKFARTGLLAAGLSVFALQALPAGKSQIATGMTGMWETETSVALGTGEIDKAAAASAAKTPTPAPGEKAPPITAAEAELFKRVKLWNRPPYNAEWEQKARVAPPPVAPAITDAVANNCDYGGFPAVMELPVPDAFFQIVIAPQETLVLVTDGEVRQIYTDGRHHPAPEDLWPLPMGDSIGHWSSSTLQIDTIARKAGPVVAIPIPGVANLSDRAHFTESLRLLDADTLQDDMTIDDPERFAHPWQISVRYKRVKNVDRLIPTNTGCIENNRDKTVNGRQTIAPP